MNIAIVGAGVSGVTLAHALIQDGHQVQVFDQRQTAAEEASYACGGLLSSGWPSPLAAPGMVWDLIYPGSSATAIRMGQWARPKDASWLFRWWLQTNKKAHQAQRLAALTLTQMSLKELSRIRQAHDLSFESTEGLTVLIKSAHDMERLTPYIQWLKDSGIPHQIGPSALAIEKEPALNPLTALHTAVHLPHDGVGNCRQFTGALKTVTQDMGVVFSFGHLVLAIKPMDPGVQLQVQDVKTNLSSTMNFDAVVMCSGTASADLLKPLGLALPMRNLRSHSLSANLRDPMDSPRSGVIDSLHNISITRMGQRIRISGGQELSAGASVHHTGVLKQLYKALFDWFPGAAQMSSVQTWSGQTPVLPDGLPLLGATSVPGVWLNLGHGLRGWSMACGSAKVVSDLMAGRDCGLDTQAFSADRGVCQ